MIPVQVEIVNQDMTVVDGEVLFCTIIPDRGETTVTNAKPTPCNATPKCWVVQRALSLLICII